MLKGEERAWCHTITEEGSGDNSYSVYRNYKQRKFIFVANQLILQMTPDSSGILQAGDYELPFELSLPSNLPGSFFIEKRFDEIYPDNNDFYTEICLFFFSLC